MCRLRNIAMRDYQDSVTTGQTHTRTDGQTDAGQSDPYVPLCFPGDTITIEDISIICVTANRWTDVDLKMRLLSGTHSMGR